MIKELKKQLKITNFGDVEAEIDSYLYVKKLLDDTEITTTKRLLLKSILNDATQDLKISYEMMIQCLELIEQVKEITDIFIKKATQKRTYFSIIDGEIKEFTDYNTDKDLEREKDGNKYDTYEEAEFQYRKNKIFNQLKKFAKDNNKEEIDWEDRDQEKWYIYYMVRYDKLFCSFTVFKQDINTVYFTSEKLAKKAIESIGEDRIKKYLFGVEV